MKSRLLHCILALAATAGLAAPAYSETPTQADSAPPANLRGDLTPRIVCGDVAGTAWAEDDHLLVTAYHVTSRATVGCYLPTTGEPAYILKEDKTADIAYLYVSKKQPYHFTVDCDGYLTGETYYGAGWPKGGYTISKVTYQGKALFAPGFWWLERELRGEPFQHGMSGGPVVNSKGFVVGIVNGNDNDDPTASYSRSLSDTELCRKGI